MKQISNSDRWASTRCAEIGVHSSFCSAFCESRGLVNLLQIVSRVSRPGEYADTEVWDFRHDEAEGVVRHPQAEVARELIQRIESHDWAQFLSRREVMENTVSKSGASRLDAAKSPVRPIGKAGEIWAWIGNYDNFVGYMAWVIKSLNAGQVG